MALRPTSEDDREAELAKRKAAQDDALLREVDEAYRQDQVTDLARRYGKPIGIGLGLALALFGGYLFWHSQRESNREEQSEELVKALDAIEAGNADTAGAALERLLADGDVGARTSARMLQAGIALRQGNAAEGARLYGQVRIDEDAPQVYRDLATIREVAATFDQMNKAEVVKRLKPLAVPGNAWFGSAGELLAMAYLEQGRRDLAGPLLAQISKDDDVPESLRSRTRQLAGVLGVDAVEDVDQALAAAGATPAPAASAAQ